MRIAVILNGVSLAKNVFYRKYLPLLQAEFQVEVFETRSAADAIAFAEGAVIKIFDVVVAAGGDGTVNQVVNGLLSHEEEMTIPVLAVLPLGSGNDFARSLNQQIDPNHFVTRLRLLRTIEIDVGEVLYSISSNGRETAKRYFVNVVDVGMGPEVVRGVNASGRAFGSAIAYYKSTVKTFFSYTPFSLRARGDNWEWNNEVRSFAIANAKYYGNGLCVAPEAAMDDGIFEVFACGPVSVLDFIIQSVPLKLGRKVDHPEVTYFRSRRIELSSAESAEIEADGEIIGWLPATITFTNRRLRILV